MVFFNYSTMQMAAKVVYYGPGLCGKTTNLHYIYGHTTTDSRGEMVSLETETDRTLFFDLLPLDVGSIAGFNTRIQLYTVPGQVFYNTTRKLVLKGVDGVVFVGDSQRAMLQANLDSFRNLEENLAEMGLAIDSLPLVLQYNKRDLADIYSVEELNQAINRQGWPHYEASAVSGHGVFETLKGISKHTLLALKRRLGRSGAESGAGSRLSPANPTGQQRSAPQPQLPALPANPPMPADPPPAGVVPPALRSPITLPPLSPRPPLSPLPPLQPLQKPTAPALAGAETVPLRPSTSPESPVPAPAERAASAPLTKAPGASTVTPTHPRGGAEGPWAPPSGQAAATATTMPFPGGPGGPAAGTMSQGGAAAGGVPQGVPPRVRTPTGKSRSVDVLGELEKLRREAMQSTGSHSSSVFGAPGSLAPSAVGRPRPGLVGSAGAATPPLSPRPASSPSPAAQAAGNGRAELSRNIEMTLKRADFARARRFLVSFQVEDEQHRIVDAVRDLQVEIKDPGDASVEKLLLRLTIALHSKE